jgi:predicted Abi (CAAX) family protease
MPKGSNYERYRQRRYNRTESYPIRPLTYAERYQPIASWIGRLILPKPEQREVGGGVLIEIQHAEDASLIGQILPLRWSNTPDVQVMVAAVTCDVVFNWRTRKTRALGIGYPERINGWKAVGPLESLAAQHPYDDVIVSLRGPMNRATDEAGQEALYITRSPLLITGRFYGLVTFVRPEPAIIDGYRVRHFSRETGAFDGPEEIVILPETLPDKKNAAMSKRESILSSPSNVSGWYVYGSPNESGDFVVQGIVPRALLRLEPQKALIGKEAAIPYMEDEVWRRIYQRKGEVLSTLLTATGQSEAEAIYSWKEGDRGLLLHVFGRYSSHSQTLGLRQPACLGHFSFGFVTVVREPLSGELRFDIEYEQVYTNNTEGVISGTNAYAHYMGDRQFGFLGSQPVVDIILKFDPVDESYDFDGVKRSPLDEFARNLEIMTARYRIADGKGGTYVGPANNCSQDSNQTLYATVRYLPQTDEELQIRADWAKRNPEEAERLGRLMTLAESLREKLFPLGSARADWREQEPTLGSSFEDNPLTSAWLSILTWRTVLPRVASDSIASIFLEQGASAWVLGTSLVGGDNDNLEAVVPLHFG